MMRQEPMQGCAKSIEVTARFRATEQLLRWCVANGHDNGGLMLRLKGTSDAEVNQLNFIFVSDHDIGRFKVTEDDGWCLTMQVAQHAAYLAAPGTGANFRHATRTIHADDTVRFFQHVA